MKKKEKHLLFDAIFISEESTKSNDKYDVIYSNINFLNALFESNVRYTEMPEDALCSYYVDYYLTQINNGGFSQFVCNSRWNSALMKKIRSGMQSMQAHKNLALFNKNVAIVEKMDSEKREKFVSGEYFGENEERDTLNAFSDDFSCLQETEDLMELNYNWLINHEKLRVLSEEEIKQQVAKIVETKQSKSPSTQ